jgi:hypothetical protein
MAIPSRSAFLTRFPELAIHPDAVVDGSLALAGRVCGEEIWGELHGDGVAYYAAHLVTQRVRQVGASVDQRTADPGGEGVMSTFYGQQYEALRLTLPLTGFVV